MLVFMIGALRAIIEMLGLCLIGQGVLYLLVGQHRQKNAIYQLFELLTRPPRQLAAWLLPRNASGQVAGMLAFLLLFLVWIGLAWLRKFL